MMIARLLIQFLRKHIDRWSCDAVVRRLVS